MTAIERPLVEEGAGDSFIDITKKGYEDVRSLASKDRAVMTSSDESETQLAADIGKRNALARDIGYAESESIAHRILSDLEHSPDRLLARVPARQRRRILEAYEQSKTDESTRRGYSSWPPIVPFFTAQDDQKTATDIWGDGRFYRGVIALPQNVNIPIRIKKYGDPEKFKRGAMVQRFLQRLERSGVIEQKINSPAFVDERNGLVAELHIGGRRLLDNLRVAGSDVKKAEMLWPTIRDYLDISIRATRAKDLRIDEKDAQTIGFTNDGDDKWHFNQGERITDEGGFYLKPRGNPLTAIRNRLPGNYVLPSLGDPVDAAVKMFGLRAVPFLRNQTLNKKGKIKSSLTAGGIDPAVAKLRDGLSHLFGEDFSKRRKYLVNLDANTTQVLVTPDQRRVYTDWDHTYFGLLEEQLAETLLTSTVTDESQLEGLIERAYNHVSSEIDGTLDDWKRVVDKKIVEKLLGRAARFVEVAKKVEDPKEEGLLKDFANEAYTLAMKKLDKLRDDAEALYEKRAEKSSWNFKLSPTSPGQIEYAKQSIREFNDKYLHLEEVPIEGRLQTGSDTIGSIVSSVQDITPLEGMKRDFRISGEPGKWRKKGRLAGMVMAAAPILAGLSYGTCRAVNQNEIDNIKTAALYNTKEIVAVDPQTDSRVVLSDGPLQVRIPEGKTLEDLFAWAYGCESAKDSDNLPLNYIIDKVTPLDQAIKSFNEIPGVDPKNPDSAWIYSNYVKNAAESFQIDPDLIRAVIIANRFGYVGGLGSDRDRIGPMGLPLASDYFKKNGFNHESIMIDQENIRAGALYLRQCGQHNQSILPDTFAEYFAGVYNFQKAKIKALEAGETSRYADYRVYLPSEDLLRTDEAIGQFLQLKTRQGFFDDAQSQISERDNK